MTNVFIILLNFNTHENTKECIESLLLLDTTDLEVTIIVIDNASEKEDKDALEAAVQSYAREKIPIHFISSHTNLGFCGGNNLGITKALEQNAEYVMLLNNDTRVDTKLLHELLSGFRADAKTGITVPKIYFEEGYEYHHSRYEKKDYGKVIWYAGGEIDWRTLNGHHFGVDEVDHGQYNTTQKVTFATGCCMFIKAGVFKKIGMLDERYFLYYEDADFSQRVLRVGLSILYIPTAIMWHKNAGSAGGSGSQLQDYYISRNRLLFGMEYGSLKVKLLLLKEALNHIIRGRMWQKKGTIDYFLSRFAKGSYPI